MGDDTVTELRHILGVFTARAERDRHSKTGNAAIVLTYDDAAAVVRERIDALAAAPVAVPDELTDLPDAEIAWAEWVANPTGDPAGGYLRGAFDAGFAAASGPWAEQLDADNAEHERVLQGVKDCWKVDMKDAREQRDRADAALARNAELEADIQNIAGGALVEEAETSVRRIHAEVERDVARQALTSADAMNRHWDEINAHRDLLVAERDALRAELDSLRDRVNALADEWHERAYSGESIVDGMFNECEVELRAIVRGSDDA